MALPTIWMADDTDYTVQLARIQGAEAAKTGLTENPWPSGSLEAQEWELCREQVLEMGGTIEHGYFADESQTIHYYAEHIGVRVH